MGVWQCHGSTVRFWQCQRVWQCHSALAVPSCASEAYSKWRYINWCIIIIIIIMAVPQFHGSGAVPWEAYAPRADMTRGLDTVADIRITIFNLFNTRLSGIHLYSKHAKQIRSRCSSFGNCRQPFELSAFVSIEGVHESQC